MRNGLITDRRVLLEKSYISIISRLWYKGSAEDATANAERNSKQRQLIRRIIEQSEGSMHLR